MKAAVYAKARSGRVLQIMDLEQPVPKDNEVLVQVCAASVNPLDWRMKRPRPGVDVAGRVVTVGRAVTHFKPGDAVFGAGRGTFAEYACAAEANIAAKPESLTFEQAAAMPIAGLTALQGLRDKGGLHPGQKVLINGAAGGIGTFAVQIAKSFGAEVTGVCSTKNIELVLSLGADQVVDYTREDFAEGRQRYDLFLDNVGNRRLSSIKCVLRPNGKCIMAGAPKKLWAVFARIFEAVVRSLFLRQKFTFLLARIKSDDLTTLCGLTKADKLTPVIDRCYTLAETARAIAYVEEGHARAKVIITPQ